MTIKIIIVIGALLYIGWNFYLIRIFDKWSRTIEHVSNPYKLIKNPD